MNRNKATGNDRELRAAKFMRTRGYPKARRSLAGRRLDEGDLENCGLVAWQIKRLKSGASRNLIRKWLQEAQKQKANKGADFGFLLYVAEFKPVAQWSVYAYLDDVVTLSQDEYRLSDLYSVTSNIIVRLDFEDMLDLLRNAGYGETQEESTNV